MSNIIIHENNIYNANEHEPSDFDGFVIGVQYKVITETETHESHGLHTITTNTIDITDSYLAFSHAGKVVYSELADDKAIIEFIKQFYEY